jgi:hypothetical protein
VLEPAARLRNYIPAGILELDLNVSYAWIPAA